MVQSDLLHLICCLQYRWILGFLVITLWGCDSIPRLLSGYCSMGTRERNHSWILAHSRHDPMLENRNNAQPRRPVVPREFFVHVEVYISNQAAAALRKVLPTYMATMCRPPFCPRNSPTRGRRLRRENPQDLSPCWAMITKEKSKVC
jgi:hypothetical protein